MIGRTRMEALEQRVTDLEKLVMDHAECLIAIISHLKQHNHAALQQTHVTLQMVELMSDFRAKLKEFLAEDEEQQKPAKVTRH